MTELVTATSTGWPERPVGVGLGLRFALGDELLATRPPEVRWLEVHPENYVRRGGRFRTLLEAASETWSFAAHGLSSCFGRPDPYDREYVADLRGFLEEIRSPWYSDHLCFGGVANAHLHDLLPVPRNADTIDIAVRRIRELQDGLGMPIAVENVSYYADSAFDEMDEVDFLNEVADRADALLLLDVNNVWVNSVNHRFDPEEYIRRIPAERVAQLHIAGHLVKRDGTIIDTHSEAICGGVYDLLEFTLERTGHVPVLLERDGNYPPLTELIEEVRAIDRIYRRVLGEP